MRQRLLHVALVVRDYDEAIAFYCDTLRFTLVEDAYQPEQDKRWVVVAPPNSTGATYLGPEPDRDLSNSMALTPRDQAEIARRDSVKGDLRQLMQLRLQSRDRWFRSHPHDLPPRP